jgi:hypothetical protein
MLLDKTLSNWTRAASAIDPTGADMATTGGAVYAYQNVQSADEVGLQFAWSGTSPVGTLAVAASNNYDQATNSGANAVWTDLPSTLFAGDTMAVSGNTGNKLLTVNLKDHVRAKWLRAAYTPTSGTGTLRCHLQGKG